jgi:hypothetical protein
LFFTETFATVGVFAFLCRLFLCRLTLVFGGWYFITRFSKFFLKLYVCLFKRLLVFKFTSK